MTIKHRQSAQPTKGLSVTAYWQALEGTVLAQQSVIAALKATVADLQQALKDVRTT